jgi:hypothetical protein
MRPLKVSFVSGEEPYDELQRRIAAILIDRVGGANEAKVDALMQKLDGKLFTFAGKNVAVVIKSVDDGTVEIERTTFHKELCAHTMENGIDLVILDPIARLHSGLDENSAEMQELHNAADALAILGNCGVVLVHHIRKSSKGLVDDQHAARGASAMTDAARIVVMMANMTRDEGKLYLPSEKQEEFMRYCKLADPKQNYSLNSAARWFQKTTVQLPVLLEDNSPDCRFVLTPWKPDQSNNVLTAKWLPAFFDKIEAGLGGGEFYHVTPMGPRGNRADALLEDLFGVPKKSSQQILMLLVNEGMLGVVEKYSPKSKRDIKVYVVLRRDPIEFNESFQ